MKKIILIVILVFTVTNIFAQEFSTEFKESKSFKVKDGYIFTAINDNFFSVEYDMPGEAHSPFATLKKLRHSITVTKFDNKMKKVKTLEVENGKKVFGPLDSRHLVFNKMIYILNYRFELKDSVRAYLTEIDPESLEEKRSIYLYSYFQVNTSLALANTIWDKNKSTEDVKSGEFYDGGGNNFRYESKTFFSISPDKSKLLIVQKSNNREDIYTITVDTNMNVSNLTTIKKPLNENYFIKSVSVDNQENRFIAYEEDKFIDYKSGVFIQNKDGKYQHNIISTQYNIGRIMLECFMNKTIVYGVYLKDKCNLGIIEAEYNGNEFGKPNYYEYSEEIKSNLLNYNENEFTHIINGNQSLDHFSFEVFETESGLFFIGTSSLLLKVSSNSKQYGANNFGSGTKLVPITGPIITMSLINNKPSFKVINKRIENYDVSSAYVQMYKDKILLYYQDRQDKFDNLTTRTKLSIGVKVLDQEGNVINSKIINEPLEQEKFHEGSYLVGSAIKVSENEIAFPSEITKINFVNYHTFIDRLLSVKLN